MAADQIHKTPLVRKLRKLAMALPETEESFSCNKLAFKARKKGFLYVGSGEDGWDVKLKLTDSRADAEQLAADEPHRYHVNPHGWLELRFPHGEAPPNALLKVWINESYHALVPAKKSSPAKAAAAKKKTPGKKTAKKSAKKKRTA